ncbi:MAG: preprotein translocase subunit SecY [Patescibacteria group bacterium]|nr:preprotein translocase subunit SecY [Patescibacteria group bacterium]
MDAFVRKLKLIVTDRELLGRIGFVLFALIAFRFLAAIPIPGIDATHLEQFFSNNQFLGLLNIFSGGGLSNLSIVMLGVAPYITASIIMQLATIIFPNLKSMYQDEGEAGRKKMSQYARILAVPLALIQGYAYLFLFESQGIVDKLPFVQLAMNVLIIAAGSMLLMWIGELVTEFGVGNGVSLIIFAGIVARVPQALAQQTFTFDASQIPVYLGFLIAALLIIYGVVVMTEAERPVPVTYAKRVRGNKLYGGVSTYLPLRLNQAGVIPIIFALSILLFPQLLLNFASKSSLVWLSSLATRLLTLSGGNIIYGVSYFFLVFLFTYFYTAVTFEPNTIATNLQKNGAFVPGVRPGNQTSEYLGRIITRITMVGGLFLGIIAVLPLIMQGLTGLKTLAIGGTALLIVVSVLLDLVRKVDARLSLKEY